MCSFFSLSHEQLILLRFNGTLQKETLSTITTWVRYKTRSCAIGFKIPSIALFPDITDYKKINIHILWCSYGQKYVDYYDFTFMHHRSGCFFPSFFFFLE